MELLFQPRYDLLSPNSCCRPPQLKWIEYGFGYMVTRSPYTPYSTDLRGTIAPCHCLDLLTPINSGKVLRVGCLAKKLQTRIFEGAAGNTSLHLGIRVPLNTLGGLWCWWWVLLFLLLLLGIADADADAGGPGCCCCCSRRCCFCSCKGCFQQLLLP